MKETAGSALVLRLGVQLQSCSKSQQERVVKWDKRTNEDPEETAT